MSLKRDFDRQNNELRPITIQRDVTDAAGSVIYSCGKTKVFVTAFVDNDVPKWRQESGEGWVTATYEMLPAATPRHQKRGLFPDGRATEIKRLIGRSLRAAVDMSKLGPRTIHIDCHVLYADAGTRTTCINAGFVALSDAIAKLIARGELEESPIFQTVEAISVGIIDGEPRLDLYYPEDSAGDVDLNVVSANGENLVEIQGTGEGRAFSRTEMNQLTDLAFVGLKQLRTLHLKTLQS